MKNYKHINFKYRKNFNLWEAKFKKNLSIQSIKLNNTKNKRKKIEKLS